MNKQVIGICYTVLGIIALIMCGSGFTLSWISQSAVAFIFSIALLAKGVGFITLGILKLSNGNIIIGSKIIIEGESNDR